MQLFCGFGEQGIEKKKGSAALQTAKVLKRVLLILMYICCRNALERKFLIEWKEKKILHSQIVKNFVRVKTATHHRGVLPTTDFVVVKCTWRFSSVTLESSN